MYIAYRNAIVMLSLAGSGTITLLQDLLGVPKDVTPDGQIHLGIKAVSADGITNTEIFTIQMSSEYLQVP